MTTITGQIEVRLEPDGGGTAEVLKAFEALAEGESLLLRTDRDPWPLYERLRSRNPDTLGWIPVATSPSEWTVEVQRMKPIGQVNRISAFFGRDHDEIDVLFSHLRADLAKPDPGPEDLASARRQFQEFDSRLDRHIRWEEEILFTAVERKSPDLAIGPGRVMREEHERIQAQKAAAGRCLAQGDSGGAGRALQAVLAILLDHNLKEEAVYYPTSDDLFSPAEVAEILRRIRSDKPGGVR